MTVADARSVLGRAQAGRYGVGAFNVIHIETAEALVAAAESVDLPVILQLSENCVRYHGAFQPIAEATLAIARASEVDVVVHLDHAEDLELAVLAIDSGFSSVMYDGARLPFAQNVARTRHVVNVARSRGVLVEAELGEIGGKGGAHAPGVRTHPFEAAEFVRETGVDALAVAVGSSHAMTSRVATLDLDLISEIRDSVPVPLVLHGSSGVPDQTIVAAIDAGITKVNVSTHLSASLTEAIRGYLAAHPTVVDSRRYIAAGREAVEREAARLLRLFSSTEGRVCE